MHIGILEPSVGQFGRTGLYNVQEIGLGKELGKRGHLVDIYKCVDICEDSDYERIAENVRIKKIRVRAIGNNTFFRCEDVLDKSLDILVSCSDIQLLTGKVYNWTNKNNLLFVPYIGIAHSTSTSKMKRTVVNLHARRVYSIFKKTGVLAKTSAVKQELIHRGINNVNVAPVGLDFDLLNNAYHTASREELLEELQLSGESKYILMVGRIENDRNPLDVVSVFEKIHRSDSSYKLIILGKGSLKQELSRKLDERKISEYVIWVNQVPNSEMWKYYRISNALVSFSRTEIFGMSILEAMYYELPVLVIHAPGPDDIIIDKENGYLFNAPDEMAERIINGIDPEIKTKAHKHIVDCFSWSRTADCIEQFAGSMKS